MEARHDVQRLVSRRPDATQASPRFRAVERGYLPHARRPIFLTPARRIERPPPPRSRTGTRRDPFAQQPVAELRPRLLDAAGVHPEPIGARTVDAGLEERALRRRNDVER